MHTQLDLVRGTLDVLGIAREVPKLIEVVRQSIGEKGVEKIQEWWLAKHRPKVLTAILALPDERNRNLLRRLQEWTEKGKEDRLTGSLGKILDDPKLSDILMELDQATDEDFDVLIDTLYDDKLHQFLVRVGLWIKEHMDEFNAKWHVRLEAWENNIQAWEGRHLAWAAWLAQQDNAVRRVLRNPLRLLLLFIPWKRI